MCLLNLAIETLLVIRTKLIWGLEEVEIYIERGLQGKWTRRKWREGKCNVRGRQAMKRNREKGLKL